MATGKPLADVKVLDFFWVLAGPGVTRSLADYGATVIRVEAAVRTDPARTVGPFKGGRSGPETSGLWWNNNAGKYGLTLDLTKPGAKAIVRDLVRWADVVTESFSPKAMRAWGFDYESLRKIKPDLIMMSSCLLGQTGPLANFAGFGNLAAALCGFYNFVGWPDRQPSGPFSAYTDYIAPRFGLAALMAALIHRKRTGEGQYIDQAQAESALQFLAMPILDTAATGKHYSPVGNFDVNYAPHGLYPAAGDDRWIAIACRTEEHWQALTDLMQRPELRRDERFAGLAQRQNNRDELDRLIAEWTVRFDPIATADRLQARGVPAHVVATSADMVADPQLRHRQHFVEVEHGTLGRTWIENSRFKLLRTPARLERSAPAFGEHNQLVLEEILGYSEERIADLVAEGALG
ncbi:MAG TPA: CoA transferase [Candidatus Binataceae bacterium]|jgi:crotonobetainyl-CoA:carnitine CoA-transferase CaiB-like acyl-CoA transferase|nr:CoA transferase [Candidatus Binataceae bacterium]